MITERLKEVESLDLHHGNGDDLNHACVMQMVSYIAGESWTDHPRCACPVLTAVAIRLNDMADYETRQKLKPIIPLLVNTRDSKTKERFKFIVHRFISVTFPIFTEALGLKEITQKLRAFKAGQWIDMRDYLILIKPDIKNAAAAAYADAAADAAAYGAAYAAAVAAKKEFWLDIKDRIWDSSLETLKLACLIKE